MTLKEQYDFLTESAGREKTSHRQQQMLSCAASMWDFWMDSRQEVMETLEDDRIKTVGSLRNDYKELRALKHTIKINGN